MEDYNEFDGWTVDEIADYIAYVESQAADADDVFEDYPGQRVTGPDFDTRNQEGA